MKNAAFPISQIKRFVVIAALTLPGITNLAAQQVTIDSSRTTSPVPGPKKYLSAKSLIIPSTFIAYGFSSLQSGGFQHLNISISKEVQEDMRGFSTHVDDYLKYAPTASVYLLNAIGVKGRHEFLGRSVILVMSTVLSSQIVTSLKHSTHELRPDASTFNSFPSGHTTTAFIGAEMLNQEFGFRSPWYSIAGYTVASGTALLRVINNRHWLSDVIAGAGIGMLSTKFCYWVYSKFEKKKPVLNRIAY
jgi:hypothetical protein